MYHRSWGTCMQEMALVTIIVDGTAIGSARGVSRRGGSMNGIECVRNGFGVPRCVEHNIRCYSNWSDRRWVAICLATAVEMLGRRRRGLIYQSTSEIL